MAWTKGQSGNPKGRPPKERALTAMLERAAGRRLPGEGVVPRQETARLVWQALATGKMTFERGGDDEKVTLRLGPDEWIRLLAWTYEHIDGPAPRAQPAPLEVVSWSPDEWKEEAEKRRREAEEVEALFEVSGVR